MFDFVGVLVLVVLIALLGLLTFSFWATSKSTWLRWFGVVLSGLLALLFLTVTITSLASALGSSPFSLGPEIIIPAILFVGLAIAFFYSLRPARAWMKWVGVVFSGLLTLVAVLAIVLAFVGFSKLNAKPGNPVSNLKAGGTPEEVAKVGRWANLCAGCHSTAQKLPLDGSKNNFAAEGPPIGTLYPPNLTPAGPLKDWSDGEIIRAIREGIHKNGRPLLIMPADVLHNLSDADVQALVAFLRSQPPVQHDTPENALNVVGAIFIAIGAPLQSNQPPITQPVVAPPAGVSAEYGKYLVASLGCHECHGKDLAGGEGGGLGPPPGPNLTAIVPKWNEADFIKTIRTGTDPTGKTLDPEQMPWKEYATSFTDDELKAVFAYLKGLPLIDKSKK